MPKKRRYSVEFKKEAVRELLIEGRKPADLARVVTGKRVILYSGYHGWQDFGGRTKWVRSNR